MKKFRLVQNLGTGRYRVETFHENSDKTGGFWMVSAGAGREMLDLSVALSAFKGVVDFEKGLSGWDNPEVIAEEIIS